MKPMGNFAKCIFALLAVFCAAFSLAQSSSQSQTIQYRYDELGRLVTTEDSRNGDRVYKYDAAGNRTLVVAGFSSSSSKLSSSSVSTSCSGVSLKIEAENYSSMFGVQAETTTDAGGGKNLGYMHPGDWMLYENSIFTAPVSGLYKLTFRLASTAGGIFRLHEADGSLQYGTISVPVTGGFQVWVDVTKDVFLNAGLHKFGLTVEERALGFNLNWFRVAPSCGASSVSSFYSSLSSGGASYSSSSQRSFSSSSIAISSSSRISSSVSSWSSSAQRSSSSQSSSVDAQAPTAPGTPIVEALNANSATISWAPAVDNIGVSGYEYSLNNGAWMPAGSSPSLTLFALTSATNYTIKVRAFDGAGNTGPESNPASFTTLDNVPPSAPGTVNLLSATHGKAKLSWLPATDNVAVGNYEYTIDAGVTWTKTNNQLTASLSGLIIGQPYTFTVRAIDTSNNVGDGVSKNFVVTRLPAPTVSLPQLIQNCAWRATWEPVAGASKYLFSEAINGGTYSRYVDSSSAVTQCPEGQPDAGRPKEVSACDDNGCGLVATFTYYTMSSSSSSTSSSSSSRSSSSALINTSTSRSSSSSSANVPTYTSSSSSIVATSTSRSSSSLAVSSSSSVDTQKPTAPGAPQPGTITANSASFTWAASTDNVGVYGYEYSLNDSTVWSPAGASPSVTVGGLTTVTNYSIKVRARDLAGNYSDASSKTYFTTADNILPSAPGAVSVKNNTNGFADVSWGAATDNVAVVGYEYSLNLGVSWTPVGNVLSVPLSGLTVGQNYNFYVRAFDAAGYRGNYSSTSFISIKKLPPPVAQARVTANCVWETTWPKVDGATSYKLYVFEGGQTKGPYTVASPYYVTCPNNQRNSTYPKEIQACNADGCSTSASITLL